MFDMLQEVLPHATNDMEKKECTVLVYAGNDFLQGKRLIRLQGYLIISLLLSFWDEYILLGGRGGGGYINYMVKERKYSLHVVFYWVRRNKF